MAERLPIIYVRGFAGGQSGIDAQTDDPFYGFNIGSTHVRVGARGRPTFYQFESPLLRLMLDHEYDLKVKGGQLAWLAAQADGAVDAATIWIHRFYDISASTFGEKPEKYSLERAAESLLELIELVQRKTGAPRVYLVAHSMGGLICRCLIQKVIPEQRGGDGVSGGTRGATDYVERLFTYATPHGGIEFDIGFGLFEKVRDLIGINGADIFGPARMWDYLNPGDPGPVPPNWDPREIPDEVFPKDRIFTLIGTNPDDYDAARGLSSRVVGAKSDGLVQIDNAYIPGARFAFVHRSHSGRYGIVNSEEGYQNLRRFLLGDLEVTADLVGVRLPERRRDDVLWQAEVELAVRGLPILMHQQVAAHHCPVVLDLPTDDSDRPQPLVTTFLISDPAVRPESAETARYKLDIRLLSLQQRRGIFDFGDHLEQTPDFADTLVVDIGTRDATLAAWATWKSDLTVPLRDHVPTGEPLTDEDPAPGRWVKRVPLPAHAREFLGERAAIQLTVRDRQGQGLGAGLGAGRPPLPGGAGSTA
ncbi:MAG: alpha/beta hydrolase [Nocardioides sp.]|nr:alpha/beta hydrolase [Nocardioides sp.]